MSTPIIPGDVNSQFVNRFIDDHAIANYAFGDPGRVTTQDHRRAIEDLDKMYAGAMQDGGLSSDDRTSLAGMLNSTNDALLDGYYDHQYGAPLGTDFDPGFYERGDGFKDIKADSDATTDRTETASTSEAAQTQTKSGEPRRAADGRIIFDAAPSLEDVKNGEATIGIGQKGEQINDIQQRLFDGGHYKELYPEGTAAGDIVDGMNGDKTTGAIKAWQKANGHEETGTLDADGLSNLLGEDASSTTSSTSTNRATNGTTVDRTEQNDAWYAGNVPDIVKNGADLSADMFVENKGDLWKAGTTEDVDIKNARGRVLAEGATHTAHTPGLEHNATIAEVRGNLGDSQGTGVDGRLAVETDVYAGVETSQKLNDDGEIVADSFKAGAYAGVDAVAEGGIGARWFGINVKGSKGLGGGAVVQGSSSSENERYSLSAGVKAGWGVTLGLDIEPWVDWGTIKSDVKGWFDGVDGSRNN